MFAYLGMTAASYGVLHVLFGYIESKGGMPDFHDVVPIYILIPFYALLIPSFFFCLVSFIFFLGELAPLFS